MASRSNGARRQRILILCRAVFGKRMSSPGIRSRHMAEVLAARLPEAEITLAIPKRSEFDETPGLPYRVVKFTQKNVPALLWSHDLIICNDYPPLALLAFPWKTFVLDYYTIYYVEWMELMRDDPSHTRRGLWASMIARTRRIGAELLLADMLFCANERQKDYYLGAYIGLGLIDPEAYARDPEMLHLIAPAPHGIRPEPLGERTAPPVIKGVYAGISENDKLIIWNGGILQWYDPLTLLHALADIRTRRNDVKLVFVGGAYPGLGSMGLGRRFNETVELAKELGLYNNTVFFDLSWVPYERIKDYMLEADLSVCTYFDNLETHFSLRTRFVDVFWAELPLVCTQGDVFADIVRERGLGVTVPQQDAPAVAAAIEQLLDDRAFYEQCRRNIRETNKEMSWDVMLQPMVEFCRNPTSSALPKWRRSVLAAGAWAQWAASSAAGMFVR